MRKSGNILKKKKTTEQSFPSVAYILALQIIMDFPTPYDKISYYSVTHSLPNPAFLQ
jgi:hypothetical protein